MLRRFFQLGLELLEQELARQEVNDRPEKSTYRGIETVAIGKDFHAAVVGSALAISNVGKGVQLAIDQQLDGGKKVWPRSPVWLTPDDWRIRIRWSGCGSTWRPPAKLQGAKNSLTQIKRTNPH